MRRWRASRPRKKESAGVTSQQEGGKKVKQGRAKASKPLTQICNKNEGSQAGGGDGAWMWARRGEEGLPHFPSPSKQPSSSSPSTFPIAPAALLSPLMIHGSCTVRQHSRQHSPRTAPSSLSFPPSPTKTRTFAMVNGNEIQGNAGY